MGSWDRGDTSDSFLFINFRITGFSAASESFLGSGGGLIGFGGGVGVILNLDRKK